MDDKTLLEAIRAIVKEETGPLSARMDSMETSMGDHFDKMDKRIDKLTVRIDKLETANHHDIKRILNLLEEDYSRVSKSVAKVGDDEEVKSTVQHHDNILENHNQRIEKLEKAI